MTDTRTLGGDSDKAYTLADLLAVMARLRDPETGCPWDVKQSFETIAPYTIEEAYEVADAIQRGRMDELKDELGDLLFQVVYHAQMARESGAFGFDDVAAGVCDKMIRRHPHVFAQANFATLSEQKADWESRKAAERADKGQHSVLDGVAGGLPALMRAVKLQKRAARAGFDWPDTAQVFDKIEEELAEVKAEIDQNGSFERLEDEVGDLLFVVVNLARHLEIDPESALRRTNAKFERRFRSVESSLEERSQGLETASLAEMESAWQDAKRKEKVPSR